MIIAFPIEISAREYLSKLFSAYKILSETNYRVVFGKKSEIYNFYKKNKGVYLLSKGGTVEHFAFKKKFPKNKLSLLDEEGPLINFIYDADFTARTNSLVLNKLSDYYCWGTKDFDLMAKVLKKNKLILSGHPKFDLCNKKYVSYFNNQKKKLKNKYGDFLLVASNFVAADGYIENDIYREWIVKAVEKKLRKKKSKDLKNYFNTDQIYYDRLIDFTKMISTQHPNLNIVFRPHPRQDINKVKKRFDIKKYKNIFIVGDGSITPFIYASEFYLHSGCTTSLEAATLGKKIFYLKNGWRNGKVLYNKFGMTLSLKDSELLSKFIDKKKKYDFKKNNIDKFIYNNRKNFFYKVLIKRLKKLDLASGKIIFGDQPKKIEILSKFKGLVYNSNILIKMISFINSNIVFNKEYKTSKFIELKTEEIKNSIKKFQNIDNHKFKFIIKKINKNAYIFEKKSN